MKYVKKMTDRHGHRRFYFNRAGYARSTLPGEPGSPEFAAAYDAAMSAGPVGVQDQPREIVPVPKVKAGSFADLCARFQEAERFTALREITQSTYRNVIIRLCAEHGDKPAALLDAKGVRAILAKHAHMPGRRNQMLKVLRLVLQFAFDEQERADNPCFGIKKLKTQGRGHPTWSEDDIRDFLTAHGRGTRAFVALALALYTGQRRADLVRMGWHMVRGRRLCFSQSKTGKHLEIPLAPTIWSILHEHCPKGRPAFLLTDFGEPFTPAGFGNWFRERCDEAALPKGFNAHGLRKAVCRRLAEAGCTVHEIAAISGHTSLSEVERYTKEASQRMLSDAALAKIGEGLPVATLAETFNPVEISKENTVVALPRGPQLPLISLGLNAPARVSVSVSFRWAPPD